ncbi:MAG: hypothetical protein FWG99_07360 [Treponema sp.]|nr:hypothetical protein [Treponema sp.]
MNAKNAWKIIGFGLIAAPLLYLAAFAIEFFACFCPGSRRCGDFDNINGCILGENVWSGASFGWTFLFLSIAGIIIGIIYAIAAGTQERRYASKIANEDAKNTREQYIGATSIMVGNVKSKSDNIVALINDAKKTIISTNAKKILEEADIIAKKSAAALKDEEKISKKAIGKTSIGASKRTQHAENASKLLEKDVDLAFDLYNQAAKEEADWNHLQQEVTDALNSAKNAKKNAEKKVDKIKNMTFASESAKDAAAKADFALTKTIDAEKETEKWADAATKAASAQDAQAKVFKAKYSEKRTLVEEKIAIEEVKIAAEAEGISIG